MVAPSVSVLEYHLIGYRKTWRGSVLSSFVLPVLFVLGFGLSVGSLVNAGGRLGHVSYLQFIVPGMIASTAMQVAFGESTFPVMARFMWIRTYHSMVAAPLSIRDILAGDLMFMILRIVTTAAVFLGVTALFGAIGSWWALAVLPTTALIGLAFAAPMFAVSGTVENTVYYAFIQRFLIIPMSLFAGVYFKISSLPEAVRWLAYVSPLWHGVELCRAMTGTAHGTLPVNAGHVAYLLVWAVGGTWLAYRSFRRRLED